jgi:CubicO group peptidase (beta-lactamase class C family)
MRGAGAIVLAMLLRVGTCAAAEPDFSTLDSAIVAEMKASATPGAAVAVVLGDSVVFRRGYGVASIETGEPVTPSTLFRVASTTKMLVAAAVATLADQGRVDLSAPVAGHADGLDPSIGRLTLHQLLSHTAGLSDESVWDGPHDEAALGAFVRSWGRERFFTEPAQVYSYSNPGYVLAGHVLAEAADTTFDGAMARLVFRPLGMHASTTLPTAAMTRPLAQAHDLGPAGPFVVRPFPDDARFRPNGGVFTSADEFARFARAFVHGGAEGLSAGTVALLSRSHGRRPGGDPADTSWIAYGLVGRKIGAVRVFQHGGARLGSGSVVRMAPERRFAVVILTNRTGSYLPRALEAITALALGPVADAAATAAKPAAGTAATRFERGERDDLVGTWVNHETDIVLGLAVVGDTLRAGHPGQVSAAAPVVVKLGRRRYAFGGQEIEAIPGPGGRTAYLHLSGRALARRASRE